MLENRRCWLSYLDVGFGDRTNLLKQILEVALRDVVMEILDGQLARRLDLVDLSLVLWEEKGRTR